MAWIIHSRPSSLELEREHNNPEHGGMYVSYPRLALIPFLFTLSLKASVLLYATSCCCPRVAKMWVRNCWCCCHSPAFFTLLENATWLELVIDFQEMSLLSLSRINFTYFHWMETLLFLTYRAMPRFIDIQNTYTFSIPTLLHLLSLKFNIKLCWNYLKFLCHQNSHVLWRYILSADRFSTTKSFCNKKKVK